jgi:glyoxylase-like metal-dependent hydrolase (beta-lactamase superfamily II)
MNMDRHPVRAPRLASFVATASALLVVFLGRTTPAGAAVAEAPSTVAAVYVDPSPVNELAPGAKIGNLFARNNTQPYILQRLTKRTYWFQHQFYGTIFYVGDKGVLVFDPVEGGAASLKEAIASVTKLPVAAVVYSHDHADHIGDTAAFLGGAKARIIASKATASKMAFLNSKHPKPTEVVAWPRGTFKFERLTVALHGFERAAHADDHAIWYLVGEKVAHLPDLVNPDQPPFWQFAGSENFAYYEGNLEQLAKLDWLFLSGGHGNVGSKADIEFYRGYLADLKQAVGRSLAEVKFGSGVDATKINAHTAFLPAWLTAVAKKTTDSMRPKYGTYYGFEAGTPSNAQMVAMAMFSYR